jgi:hypothetical protein
MEGVVEDDTVNQTGSSMATKKPDDTTAQPPKVQPDDGPVKTQMLGEHGDDDLGYDPSIIPTEKIPDDD